MKAIVATSKNNIIGNDGQIPWQCPEDLKWFKEFTTGKRLIVGRKTWDSLPDLQYRRFCILTNQYDLTNYVDSSYDFENDLAWEYMGVKYLEVILENEKNFENDDMIVAGGAKIYELMIPHITEFYQTVVDIECEGDTKFPFQFSDHFQCVEEYRKLSEKATVYKWSKAKI
jgi:dihydrofolate reductase